MTVTYYLECEPDSLDLVTTEGLWFAALGLLCVQRQKSRTHLAIQRLESPYIQPCETPRGHTKRLSDQKSSKSTFQRMKIRHSADSCLSQPHNVSYVRPVIKQDHRLVNQGTIQQVKKIIFNILGITNQHACHLFEKAGLDNFVILSFEASRTDPFAVLFQTFRDL